MAYGSAGFLNVPTGPRLVCEGCGFDFYALADRMLLGEVTVDAAFADAPDTGTADAIAEYLIRKLTGLCGQTLAVDWMADKIGDAANARRAAL